MGEAAESAQRLSLPPPRQHGKHSFLPDSRGHQANGKECLCRLVLRPHARVLSSSRIGPRGPERVSVRTTLVTRFGSRCPVTSGRCATSRTDRRSPPQRSSHARAGVRVLRLVAHPRTHSREKGNPHARNDRGTCSVQPEQSTASQVYLLGVIMPLVIKCLR